MARTGEDTDVRIAKVGRIGHITLDRPKALNALTLPMLRAIAQALADWRDNDRVLAVAVDGAGERGLCAGGDIRAIYRSLQAGDGMAAAFWREEYALNAQIAAYPKPYVVLMDGLVMGGGVGISAHGSHRLVTPRTALAMPETSIGFFPDVGGTWLLSRAPGELGTYLALTGARIGSADTILCGLADGLIELEQWPALVGALAGSASKDDVARCLAGLDGSGNEEPRLARNRAEIDRSFASDRVEEIFARLERAGSPFAADTLATLRARSPMALKVTLAALRLARSLATIGECLALELAMTGPMARRPDFPEGIRAAVIDKDQAPRWSPATLEAISDADVGRIVHQATGSSA